MDYLWRLSIPYVKKKNLQKKFLLKTYILSISNPKLEIYQL